MPTEDELDLPRLAGDWTDDDAAIRDDMLDPAPEVPADALPMTGSDVPPVTLADSRQTRMLTGTLSLSGASSPIATGGPVLILPADPRRKSLLVRIQADAASGPILLADDAGKTMSLMGSYRLTGDETAPLRIDHHTGALWANFPQVVGACTFSWLAVTE